MIGIGLIGEKNKMKYDKSKILIFSFDDGVKQDVPFVELLNKYGMKCTFNMFSAPMMSESGEGIKPHELPTLFAGHEIAAHAHNHPHLERMPLAAQYDQIIKDREILEPHYGKIIRGRAHTEALTCQVHGIGTVQ